MQRVEQRGRHSTKLGRGRLRDKSAEEQREVTELAERIKAKIGFFVEVKRKKASKWGLYAPKNFAFARKIKSRNCWRISTSEKWAVRAGVDRLRDGTSSKGWFRSVVPSVWWEMHLDNEESKQKVALILALVCEARHREEIAQPSTRHR